jgi:hypothetical protein
MYEVKRSDEEIDELINKCHEQANKGRSKYPGMSFEEGVREALDWVFGDQEENPLAEE